MRVSRQVLALGGALVWLGGTALAQAEPAADPDPPCAAHAAAMVAEMEAARTTPLSADERELVRQTALASCRARTEATDDAPGPEDTVGNAGRAEATAGAAEPARTGGFWGFLSRLPEPHERTAGHKRLQRRGRY